MEYFVALVLSHMQFFEGFKDVQILQEDTQETWKLLWKFVKLNYYLPFKLQGAKLSSTHKFGVTLTLVSTPDFFMCGGNINMEWKVSAGETEIKIV